MNDFSFRPVEAYNFVAPKLASDRVLQIGAGLGGVSDSVEPVENRIYLVPFAVRQPMRFNTISFAIPPSGTSAEDASCQARLGVYRVDPRLWLTAAVTKVFDALISSGLNSTGEKAVAIDQTLPAGVYLGACIINRNGGSGAMPRPSTITSAPSGFGNLFFGSTGSSPSGSAHGVVVAAYKDETIPDWGAYTLPASISAFSYMSSINSGAPYTGLKVA